MFDLWSRPAPTAPMDATPRVRGTRRRRQVALPVLVARFRFASRAAPLPTGSAARRRAPSAGMASGPSGRRRCRTPEGLNGGAISLCRRSCPSGRRRPAVRQLCREGAHQRLKGAHQLRVAVFRQDGLKSIEAGSRIALGHGVRLSRERGWAKVRLEREARTQRAQEKDGCAGMQSSRSRPRISAGASPCAWEIVYPTARAPTPGRDRRYRHARTNSGGAHEKISTTRQHRNRATRSGLCNGSGDEYGTGISRRGFEE